MIQREALNKLVKLANTFKIVAVVGPRQSGKTTLVKLAFPKKKYISLENPDIRSFALEDPRGFLENIKQGAILDEIQRVPILFSYLQEIVDSNKEKGLFILTGSNNFLLQENISQTLAGRLAYLTLLPFSISELNTLDYDDNTWMFNGFYPPIYDQKITPQDWIPNYIKTYVERDVRQLKNISNLFVFEKFIRILAGYTGQELNASAISVAVGVDIKTIQSWIGILENSFIVYLLKPHYNNFKKRIVKRPKLYFYDTALVCYLLGIRNKKQLETHPLRGSIFETMVIGELTKYFTNTGEIPPLFYWRDKTGHEVDVLIDLGNKILPIEIKSGMTISTAWFKNVHYWKKLSNEKDSFVLYAGNIEQNRSDNTHIINWKNSNFITNYI